MPDWGCWVRAEGSRDASAVLQRAWAQIVDGIISPGNRVMYAEAIDISGSPTPISPGWPPREP